MVNILIEEYREYQEFLDNPDPRNSSHDRQIELENKTIEINITQQALAKRLRLGNYQSAIYRLFESYIIHPDELLPIKPYLFLTESERRDLGKESPRDPEKNEDIKMKAYKDTLTDLRNIAYAIPGMRLIWIPSTVPVPPKYERKSGKYTKKEVQDTNRLFADTVIGEGEGDEYLRPPKKSLMSRAKSSASKFTQKIKSKFRFSRRSHPDPLFNPLAAEALPFDELPIARRMENDNSRSSNESSNENRLSGRRFPRVNSQRHKPEQ